MESVKRMIDKATPLCGSKSAVAHRLGVSPQTLYNWETGRRPMPDHQLIELALLAGADPKAALGAYHWEWHEKKQASALAGIAVAGFFLAALLAAGTTTDNAQVLLLASLAPNLWGSAATHYAQCFVASALLSVAFFWLTPLISRRSRIPA